MNFLFSYETLEIMKAMDWLIWGWCFVIYTIVRIRELQEAEWAEFKLEDDNPIWSIQVERIKMRLRVKLTDFEKVFGLTRPMISQL